MFCLNIALGHTSWRLLYKTEENALEAVARFNVIDTVKVADDFGQALEAKVASIHGYMLEDMDKTKLAHVEMALHQARTQNLATKTAQTDPGLRTAQAINGPSVLSPMGNGFRPS